MDCVLRRKGLCMCVCVCVLCIETVFYVEYEEGIVCVL